MLFNSIEFFIYLPIVFVLYWFIGRNNLRARNFILVAASYFFYGFWDYRFLGLIFLSSLLDYVLGLKMAKTEDNKIRKRLLSISVLVNLGSLGFFKYFNFFLDNFAQTFTFFGGQLSDFSLNIILPVGISFYTFQTLSYTIDVYRKKIEPTKDIVAFFAFVSFFPQLVAGPIERATNLLPQFYKTHTFDYENAKDGLRQVLWGLFKKVVIADNCAVMVNEIFANYETQPGSTLLMGGFLFAFQIYGDFSGYSDIAIGISRLFGFDLKQNFAFPYFSRDIAEFWRRWHISLSSWFRDYLYIPLGGSRGSTYKQVRNVFIIFIVSGFWHGANWTFIAWGTLNAIYFLPLLLLKKNRKNTDEISSGKLFASAKEIFGIITTFLLTILAWIFFRADSFSQAIDYLSKLFTKSLFSIPQFDLIGKLTIGLILFFIVVEWLNRSKKHVFENLKQPLLFRWSSYLVIIFLILIFGGEQQEFIYFQF